MAHFKSFMKCAINKVSPTYCREKNMFVAQPKNRRKPTHALTIKLNEENLHITVAKGGEQQHTAFLLDTLNASFQ